MIELTSLSQKETESIGFRLGQNLMGGELIVLDGDLGSGKTTLTNGIVKGAGSVDEVSSPSFVIKNEYRAKDFTIAHFDFYRLSDAGIMADFLKETLNDRKYVTIIEWSNIVSDLLNQPKVLVKLLATSENGRKLTIDFDQQYDYLFRDIL